MVDLVHHPLFTDALSKVERTIEAAKHGSGVSCVVVDGPSGSGKTMLQEYLASRYSVRREPTGLKVPLVRIPMPSNPTIKSLCSLIIDAVGDGVPARGTEATRTQWAIRQMCNAETEVLVFDDVQHIVDHCSYRDQCRITDWIKHVVDQTQSALILCGLPRLHLLIALNDQLARRFNSTAHLRQLRWEDSEDRQLFLDIVYSIQQQLSDYSMPELDGDEFGFRVYAATAGLPGYLVKLIEETLRIANRQGTSTISVDTLAEAHDFTTYRKAPGIEQPFDLDVVLEPDAETLAHIEAVAGEAPDADGARSVA